MPELVACPNCGCRVQMAEGALGRRVRCFGCGQSFVAAADPPEPERPREPPPPEQESGVVPRCLRCGRRVPWQAPACPGCGTPLDGGPGFRWHEPFDRLRRRDSEPHRGALIGTLGTVSLYTGVFSLCLGGLGAAVSVPLGAVAWGMANRDLQLMRTGLMDPAGRPQTEQGRTSAVAGLVLGVLFGALAAGFFWTRL